MSQDSRNPFVKGAIARAYDAWYGSALGAAMHRWQMDLVMRMSRPLARERALDVGTGTGHYACALADRGLRVIGLDPSAEMLSVARAKSAAVSWLRGVAEQLPFPDGTFDLVVSVTAIEFVRDPARTTAEICRVLKPGGRMVMGTLNSRGPWGRLYQEMALDPESPFHQAQLRTSEQFCDLLSCCGAVRWNSSGFLPASGRAVRAAPLLERLGRVLWRRRGALLVGRVEK